MVSYTEEFNIGHIIHEKDPYKCKLKVTTFSPDEVEPSIWEKQFILKEDILMLYKDIWESGAESKEEMARRLVSCEAGNYTTFLFTRYNCLVVLSNHVDIQVFQYDDAEGGYLVYLGQHTVRRERDFKTELKNGDALKNFLQKVRE